MMMVYIPEDCFCMTVPDPYRQNLDALFLYFKNGNQARGRLGRYSSPRGRNFALNGTQGEVGVSLKKKKNFFFFLC